MYLGILTLKCNCENWDRQSVENSSDLHWQPLLEQVPILILTHLRHFPSWQRRILIHLGLMPRMLCLEAFWSFTMPHDTRRRKASFWNHFHSRDSTWRILIRAPKNLIYNISIIITKQKESMSDYAANFSPRFRLGLNSWTNLPTRERSFHHSASLRSLSHI